MYDATVANRIPSIIREIFFINPVNEKYGLSDNDHIPNAQTTLNYLRSLWPSPQTSESMFPEACRNGAIYLIPRLDQMLENALQRAVSDPNRRSESRNRFYEIYFPNCLNEAVKAGQIDIVKLLMRIVRTHKPHSTFNTASGLISSIENGYSNIMLYLLENDQPIKPSYFDRIVNTVARTGNIALMKSLFSEYPTMVTIDTIVKGVKTARENNHYQLASWLAGYH